MIVESLSRLKLVVLVLSLDFDIFIIHPDQNLHLPKFLALADIFDGHQMTCKLVGCDM